MQFNRDAQGILRTVEAGIQRLTFEYDDQRRVIRAVHGAHEASYTYDHLGRLVRAVVDRTTRSFGYGSRDEMVTVQEPGRSIANTYDTNGRLTRQVVRWPGRPDYVEAFAYAVEGRTVLETTVTDNDGSRTTYRWNEGHQQDVEIHEADGHSPVIVQFARGDGTFTRAITVFCKEDGHPVTDTMDVTPGGEERAVADLIGRVCN